MTNNEFTICYAELVLVLKERGYIPVIPVSDDSLKALIRKYALTDEAYNAIRDTKKRSREKRMEKTQREELARGLRICRVAMDMASKGVISPDEMWDDLSRVVIYNYVVAFSVTEKLNTKYAFDDLKIKDLSIKYKRGSDIS